MKTNVNYTVTIIMKNGSKFAYFEVSHVDISLTNDIMYIEFPSGSRTYYHWSDIRSLFQEVNK